MLNYFTSKKSKKHHSNSHHHSEGHHSEGHHHSDGHHHSSHSDEHHHSDNHHSHHHGEGRHHGDHHHTDDGHEDGKGKGKARDASSDPIKSPVLSPVDEQFLERIISDDASEVPLPETPQGNEVGFLAERPVHEVVKGGHVEYVPDEPNTEGQPVKKPVKEMDRGSPKSKKRWSFMQNPFGSKKDKSGDSDALTKKGGAVTPNEAASEHHDLAAVLENLNLAAENNRVFSLSKESQVLVQKFTLVLKDIVNGVPTAYDDLVNLLEGSQGQLHKKYSDLPPWLQKFVRTLPKKFNTTLAPELLATAAGGQAMSGKQTDDMKTAAKQAGLRMPSLQDMVTKPGAVVGILKSIMNFLKLRWPAFMGTSALTSIGLFVLLLVFWYCHKRGREVRLAKERLAAGEVDDSHRFEELDDDDTDDNDTPSRPHQKALGPSNISNAV